MELNGLANIHAIVSDLKYDGKISELEFKLIEDKIFEFKEYLIASNKDKNIKWHEFIAKREKLKS